MAGGELDVAQRHPSARAAMMNPARSMCGCNIDVSFSLVANAPADSTRSRVVQKSTIAKFIDRQSFASRPADGSATIDETTYPTVLPDSGCVSTIDVSGQTTITRGACPPAP